VEDARRLVPFGLPQFVHGSRVRPTLTAPAAREVFFKAGTAGVTTALRVGLPAGVALTSAMREVFNVTTVDTPALAAMARGSAEQRVAEMTPKAAAAHRRQRKEAQRRSMLDL
jgi:hypothetical protein